MLFSWVWLTGFKLLTSAINVSAASQRVLIRIACMASVGGLLRGPVVRVVVAVPLPAAHAALGCAGGGVHAGACLCLVIGMLTSRL